MQFCSVQSLAELGFHSWGDRVALWCNTKGWTRMRCGQSNPAEAEIKERCMRRKSGVVLCSVRFLFLSCPLISEAAQAGGATFGPDPQLVPLPLFSSHQLLRHGCWWRWCAVTPSAPWQEALLGSRTAPLSY